MEKCLKVLEAAFKTWSAGASLRHRRERYKNYTYGDQWCDLVRGYDGKYIREDLFLRKTGAKPMSNNLIRQLIKTVVGRYRSNVSESNVYSDDSTGAIADMNCLPELDSRLLEEFLISGCAIQRISRERRWCGSGTWVDNVDPRLFFVNAFKDPRGCDIDLVGMLHSMTIGEIINRFADGNEERALILKQLYNGLSTGFAADGVSLGESGYEDFYQCSESGRCRVIEVWTFDSRPSEKGSACLDFAWHCRWLAPDGTVLKEYDSPFGHSSHPFAVKFYPLTDGEVHSFVEDVIDNQRYINRLIVTIDKIMTTSAKGVLLFPENQKSESTDWEYICNTWAHSDGVIPITGRGDKLPQQVITNTSDSGAYRLLEMQLKLFEDISGVSEALLGRTSTSARGVDMFDSQIRNATIALADIFETFNSFVRQRNKKMKSC